MDDQTRSNLIVTRRKGETLRIGDSITIEVVRVGQAVRLAIRAPRHIPVDRAELLDPPK